MGNRLTGVVLAGGSSESLEALSGEINKSFIKIMGKTLLEYILEALSELDFSKIIIIADDTGKAEEISRRFGGVEIRVRRQTEPGILGAYRSSRDLLDNEDSRILIVYGDIVVKREAYRSVIYTYEEESSKESFGGVFLGVAEEPRRNHWLIESDESGVVKSLVPSTVVSSGYIAGGIYLVRREFFDLIDKYDELYKVFNEYIKRYRVKLLHWGHHWIDIGSPWDLLKASYVMLNEIRETRISASSKISHRAVIEGPVIIEDDVEIDHYSLIKGPVYIGRKSFVGAYSFIRDHSMIGEDVSIASNVEINRSLIMSRATIGRGSYISYSVIGVEAIIEPNVVVKPLLRREIEEAYRSLIRGKRYSKMGAIVYSRARVSANRVLEPGEVIESEAI